MNRKGAEKVEKLAELMKALIENEDEQAAEISALLKQLEASIDCAAANAKEKVSELTEQNQFDDSIEKIQFLKQLEAVQSELSAVFTHLETAVDGEPFTGNEERKIGKFVRSRLKELSESGFEFSEEQLENMQSKSWSKKHLNLDYEMVRTYDETKELIDQVMENRYRRYWNELFIFNDKKYFVTSQWFERNRRPFEVWFDSLLFD